MAWWHGTDSYPNMLHLDLREDMVHIILPQNMFGRLYLCTTPMAACKGVILPYGTCPVNTSLQTMSNSISLLHRVEWILSLNKELNLRGCTVAHWLESVAAACWPNQKWHGMKHSLQTHKTSQASCWLGRHICLKKPYHIVMPKEYTSALWS